MILCFLRDETQLERMAIFMTKILEVVDLTYTYTSKSSLFEDQHSFELGPISFDMQLGETIAIIGNNGSGKTMLAKLLAGAMKATSGTIEFIAPPEAKPDISETFDIAYAKDDKQSVQINQQLDSTSTLEHTFNKLNKPDAVKHASSHPIRLILQHSVSSMNPAISIGSVMHNTLKLNTNLGEPQRKQKIEDTLRIVGLLPDHYYYYKHMLSDGQQQRVALARALLLDPKIIVADEPFAALDPSVRSQTVNLIIKLQKELGLGFVFISHNIGIVRHMSDRVFVMDNGKIIEQGKTEEVYKEPKQALTQKLVQSHFNLVERHLNLL